MGGVSTGWVFMPTGGPAAGGLADEPTVRQASGMHGHSPVIYSQNNSTLQKLDLVQFPRSHKRSRG